MVCKVACERGRRENEKQLLVQECVSCLAQGGRHEAVELEQKCVWGTRKITKSKSQQEGVTELSEEKENGGMKTGSKVLCLDDLESGEIIYNNPQSHFGGKLMLWALDCLA